MQQIADWLEKLGMSEYGSALPRMTSILKSSARIRTLIALAFHSGTAGNC